MSISSSKGKQVEIKLWAPLEEVEPAAIKQLQNIASLPWVFHHVAAMADVHLGKGATVGSVIAMRGAVSPAAVGVDIGCFTGDTLIPLLDGKEHPIKSLAERGEEIFVYSCLPKGKIVAAKATAKLTRRSAPLVEVELDHGRAVRCTPDHQFMLRNGQYKEARDLRPGESLMPFYSRLDKDGYTAVRQPYSNSDQRTHWIAARSGLLGEIPRFQGQKTIIHHKDFTPTNNLPSNLEFMGDCDHSTYHRSLVERNTYWQSPEFEQKRIAVIQHQASHDPIRQHQLKEVGTRNILRYMKERPAEFKKAVEGNGRRGRKYLQNYNASAKGRAKSKELANRLYPCEFCGEEVKSWIGLYNHKKGAHGIGNNHKVKHVRQLEGTEDVYCLTVPEYHNFAISAGVFVHNCGMAAVQTNLTANDLPDSLSAVRLDLEAAIPVGFAAHPEPVERTTKSALWEEFSRLTPEVQDKLTRAMAQMGTLGGGNHFVEVCLDTKDGVWLMLHSGSRNIGKSLAEVHMSRAKKLIHNQSLPDKDLAVFLAGTPQMEAYRRDLFWAQRYARENRETMIDLALGVLRKHFRQLKTGEVISCHHNYVSEETHFGEEVLVTRKGAIRAGKGEMGIIPGSMGTRSYIVRGLGNPESFESASHGAGRKMSRNAARRAFTVQDLEEQTKGIECRKDEGVLDEIPGAYKSIEQVMENQKDLVEVVAEIRQVLCVKG